MPSARELRKVAEEEQPAQEENRSGDHPAAEEQPDRQPHEHGAHRQERSRGRHAEDLPIGVHVHGVRLVQCGSAPTAELHPRRHLASAGRTWGGLRGQLSGVPISQ